MRHGAEDATLSKSSISLEGLSASRADPLAGIPKILISPLPLVPLVEWHRDQYVLAFYFHAYYPILHREEGESLEIAFDIMMQLTRRLRLTQ